MKNRIAKAFSPCFVKKKLLWNEWIKKPININCLPAFYFTGFYLNTRTLYISLHHFDAAFDEIAQSFSFQHTVRK